MTKSEKENQRKKMMWTGLWAIIAVMLLIIGLVYMNKPVADLGFVAAGFFAALAGVNGASLFTQPSYGGDDPHNPTL